MGSRLASVPPPGPAAWMRREIPATKCRAIRAQCAPALYDALPDGCHFRSTVRARQLTGIVVETELAFWCGFLRRVRHQRHALRSNPRGRRRTEKERR